MSAEGAVASPITEISREWAQYMVKASLSERLGAENGASWPVLPPHEIEAYHESLAANFESHIYLCPNPILMNVQEVVDVLIVTRNDKVVRIYPPFPVNETSETSGAFTEITVPEGIQKVERTVEIPSSAVRGARMEHGAGDTTKWCRGFRLDVETGADGLSALKLLLDHICQYTHQWWIRASHNPMLGYLRMGAAITKDFKIIPELRYRGAGDIEATWYGAVQYQPHLGFGSPLTHGTWLLAAHHTQEERKADQGLLAFHDGMADYMADQDHKAILNLCIATEIILSKHSAAVLKRSPSKLEKAARTTRLVDDKTRNVLAKLIADRNSVAHGREPYVISQDNRYSIEAYIQAVGQLVNSYLKAMPSGTWPQVMDLRLQSPKHTKTTSTEVR